MRLAKIEPFVIQVEKKSCLNLQSWVIAGLDEVDCLQSALSDVPTQTEKTRQQKWQKLRDSAIFNSAIFNRTLLFLHPSLRTRAVLIFPQASHPEYLFPNQHPALRFHL